MILELCSRKFLSLYKPGNGMARVHINNHSPLSLSSSKGARLHWDKTLAGIKFPSAQLSKLPLCELLHKSKLRAAQIPKTQSRLAFSGPERLSAARLPEGSCPCNLYSSSWKRGCFLVSCGDTKESRNLPLWWRIKMFIFQTCLPLKKSTLS